MNKRGLSDIVVTLIIVLLSMVAIGVVWVVVNNLLQSGTEQTTSAFDTLTLNMEIERVLQNSSGVSVTVSRGSGSGNIAGVAIVLSDGENSKVIRADASNFNPLEQRNFFISSSELGEVIFVKEVSVSPIVGSDYNRGSVGNVLSSLAISNKQVLSDWGAVSWWKLDGNANDELGNNPGTISNGAWVEGKYSESFNSPNGASTNYINISGSGSLKDITDDGKSFSFSCWFKPNGLPQQTYDGYILFRAGYHTGFYHTKSNGELRSVIWFSDNTSGGINSGINSVAGTWYFLTMTVDETNNQFKFYVNGKQVGNTYTITKALRDYSTNFNIMGTPLSPSYIAYGSVDEAMIFDKALTAEQVKALYEMDLSN